MKILQRYIFRELWLPFLVSLLTLSFIFMAAYLVRAANFIIGRGVPLADTIYVLILALPSMVSYTVPMSILTAVLIVFGSLSQNNEIRAIKASGIHPVQVMKPAFLVGLGISLAMFVFIDQFATSAGFQLRKTTKQVIIKHPNALIDPGRFVKISDTIVFLAKEMEGNQMREIVAYENEGGGKPVRTILAERGEIVTDPDQVQMQIRLYNGSISDAEDDSVQAIQFETYELPSLGQEDIRKMRKKMKDLTLAELVLESRKPGITKAHKKGVKTAFHHRIAFSFGSFLFVFVGIPIAILVHRGEIVLSFAISMAAACLYYIFFVGAKTLAVQGFLPVIVAFWIPNVVLLGLGGHLLRRSVAV